MSTPADRIDARQGTLESGTWKGEYLDAYGHRGGVRFELDASGDDVRGRYEITVRSEDQPHLISGTLEGRVEGNRARLHALAGKEGRRVEFDAVIGPAGSYARQALFGTVQDVPEQNFGGGVWIAWRFAGPDSRQPEKR